MISSDNPIAEAIDRFRRAFALAGIAERGVKVTWDVSARWCRLRCRLPDGRVIERVLRGDETPKGRTELLMREMSLWTLRAAKRLKAGEEFVDDTAKVLGREDVPRG